MTMKQLRKSLSKLTRFFAIFTVFAMLLTWLPASVVLATSDTVVLDMDFSSVNNGVVADASGNNHNATLKGSATVKNDARFGSEVLELNGVDSWAQIDATAKWQMKDNSQLTFEVVFMAYEDNTYKTNMVLFNRAAARTEYNMALNSDQIIFQLKAADGETYDFVTAPYVAGKIYHVVGTYNGAELKLYVNGDLADSKTVTGDITYNVTVNPSLGAGVNGGSGFFHGAIDSYYIDKTVLSADDIAVRYHTLQNRIDFSAQYEGIVEDFSLKVVEPEVLPAKGDTFTATLKLRNSTDVAYNNVKLSAVDPYHMVSLDKLPATIDIPANSTVELPIRFKVLEGGHEPWKIVAELDDGTTFVLDEGLAASGPGVYSGDSHTHSLHSDGGGTVAKNAQLAYDKNFVSWIFATDHNVDTQYADTQKVTANYNGSMLGMMGVEFTTYYGHTLNLGIIDAFEVPDNYLYESEVQRGDTVFWQTLIDNVNEAGGIFYFAHPYQQPVFTFTDATLRDARNHEGIEVWNGFDKATDRATKHALWAWECMNSQGTGKYSAIANTDGHETLNIGLVKSKAYLTSLSEENVMAALEKGNLVGTNGPNLRFDIGGVQLSETYYVVNNGDEAIFNIYAYDPDVYLTEVRIIRCSITGKFDSNAEVVYSQNLTGQNKHSYEGHIALPVKDGEFYRVEVTSEESARHAYKYAAAANGYDYTSDIGFAFTNNIWIENAEKSNSTQLNSVNYDVTGYEVAKTPAGILYLDMNNGEFDLKKVAVVCADGVQSVAAFDETSSLVTITLTAEDGSKTTREMYVINYSSVAEEEQLPPDGPNPGGDPSTGTTVPGTGDGNEDDNLPATGDSTMIMPSIMLMAFSLFAITAVLSLHKKRG